MAFLQTPVAVKVFGMPNFYYVLCRRTPPDHTKAGRLAGVEGEEPKGRKPRMFSASLWCSSGNVKSLAMLQLMLKNITNNSRQVFCPERLSKLGVGAKFAQVSRFFPTIHSGFL